MQTHHSFVFTVSVAKTWFPSTLQSPSLNAGSGLLQHCCAAEVKSAGKGGRTLGAKPALLASRQ